MAGYFYGTDNKYHGFFLSGPGGAFTQIDAPGGARGTYVTAMNDSGEIVGWYRDASRNDHGFLLSGGVYTTIDATGADQGTYTVAINNFGEILGYSADSGGPGGYEQHGYVFSTAHGFTQQIDAPGATDNITTVVGMNRFNEVAGYFWDGRTYHSFVFSQDSFTIIEPPYPYSHATASGINDFEQIAGIYQIDANASFPLKVAAVFCYHKTNTQLLCPREAFAATWRQSTTQVKWRECSTTPPTYRMSLRPIPCV